MTLPPPCTCSHFRFSIGRASVGAGWSWEWRHVRHRGDFWFCPVLFWCAIAAHELNPISFCWHPTFQTLIHAAQGMYEFSLPHLLHPVGNPELNSASTNQPECYLCHLGVVLFRCLITSSYLWGRGAKAKVMVLKMPISRHLYVFFL